MSAVGFLIALLGSAGAVTAVVVIRLDTQVRKLNRIVKGNHEARLEALERNYRDAA